jgi:hypothetical protein
MMLPFNAETVFSVCAACCREQGRDFLLADRQGLIACFLSDH